MISTLASRVQKEKLAGSLENYCSEYIVSDFSFIGDEELKKSCITAAMDAASQYLETGENKADVIPIWAGFLMKIKKQGWQQIIF